ncbi:hypothetical protein P5704_025100 (plasmid) [Pseudomonas sp. FeN3W]|nr:hypothetical protein P5704_025100 [Pseudomonas sp. FeN3W]
MKIVDFHIGLNFQSHGGLRYRCTDVGSRTIAAIRLDVDDEIWIQGPPYLQSEILMDEAALVACYPDGNEGLRQMLTHEDQRNHPGYSPDVIKKMIEGKFSDAVRRYPRGGLLKIDKCFKGDIAHPYSVKQDSDGSWQIMAYLLFAKRFIEMPDIQFAHLVTASADDFETCRA